MQPLSLAAVADEQLVAAHASPAGRSARTIHGGRGHLLRQTVLALTRGRSLGEHQNPGEATLQVLTGKVQLSVGDAAWEGGPDDYLIIPSREHDLAALEDSTVLLSVVVDGSA